MLERRAFLAATLALAASRVAAQSKPAPRQYRIGFLDPVSQEANAANMAEFRKGLKEEGYVEGQNLVIEYRSGEGRAERFPQLAAELVARNVDLIVTGGTPATLAARAASSTLPIVTATVIDPVETKLVASLDRPGGNVTGLAIIVNELEAKRVELLRALAPGRKRLGALIDMSNPAFVTVWNATEAGAKAVGMQSVLVDVRRPEDLPKAFESVAGQADALVIRMGVLASANVSTVVELAGRHKLPAIYAGRQFVEAGGLASYGVNSADMYYRAAGYVDKILKGAKPGELPMERPSKFELVINRKTVRALGLVIPPDLLLRSTVVD